MKNKIKHIGILTLGGAVALTGTYGIANYTAEDIYDITPNFISENLNEEIDFTGLEYKGDLPELPEKGESGKLDLPKWEDIKDDILFLPTEHQTYGKCAYYSFNYMLKEAMIQLGIDVDDEFIIDVDLGYTTRAYQSNKDTGTVINNIYTRLQTVGLPIAFRPQVTVENREKRVSYTQHKEDVFNETIEQLVLKGIIKKTDEGFISDSLISKLDEYRKLGEKIVYRISIKGNDAISVYHREVPKILSPVNKFRNSAHSLAGIGSVYAFEFDNEPAFATYESTGSVAKHIFKKSVVDRILYKWEIYLINNTGVEVDVLTNTVINYGDKGDNVKALQKYLNVTADGVYGNQTKRALQDWQLFHWGYKYSGLSWGTGNMKLYKKL